MIRVRPMTEADLPLGMALKAQAGWNQTEADWRRFLALQPDGCFVAEWQGRPAGTVTTCIFETTAWVAMVLVDISLRGRGIGSGLLRHALAFLDERKVRRVRLDATPLGRPLYEKLGFAEEYGLVRYEGVLSEGGTKNGSIPSCVDVVNSEAMAELVRLDRDVTKTDRQRLLERLWNERPDEARAVLDGRKVAGYLMARPGTRALHVGPCAANGAAGRWLLDDAHRRHAGETIFLDVPIKNGDAVAWAEARGLRVQRPFLRMCRGPRPEEDATRLWATSGPEKG